jgi:integrase
VSDIEQLQLFPAEPFSFRLSVPEALRLFWEIYFQHLPSGRTCKPHQGRLASFFRDFHLDTVSKVDIECFRRSMKAQGYAEATINKAHMVLARVYTKMAEFKEAGRVQGFDFTRVRLPEKNPAAQVRKVNERQFARRVSPTKEKVGRLVAFAKQFGYHDLADIIEGLYFSRLRQSDFFRLTSSSVDLAHGLLQGTQHKTITTSNPSGVPFLVVMPAPLVEIVSRRIQEVKPGSPLFRRYNLQKRFDRVRKVAGLAYVTLQDMRRAAATHLLDNGVDPQTVADSLGHTTLRNLPSYTPRTLRHYREASEKLMFSVGE